MPLPFAAKPNLLKKMGTKVSYHYVVIVHKQIVSFKVSVHDVDLMESFEAKCDLSEDECCFFFMQMAFATFINVLADIPVVAKLHCEVITRARLHEVVQMDYVIVVYLLHDADLGVKQVDQKFGI
jgi:hypothetical protein